MNDNMNYSYKEAFKDMTKACERAMETSRKAINTAVEIEKKRKTAMVLLYNCVEYITESIGDKEEADRVLISLGLTTEVINSLAD